MDTGCTSTILSTKKFNEIPEGQRPKVEPQRSILTSADGSAITVLGTAVLNITVGLKEKRHRVIVADVSNEGLIGMDFMKANGMIIDFSTRSVSWGGEKLAAYCRHCTEREVKPKVTPGTRTTSRREK